jgi:hypothetical protein
MRIDPMEGRWRRDLEDIQESMCQLGFLSCRLLGPTEAEGATMETLLQWTLNFEGQILDRLWTSSLDFKLKDALLLLMQLNTWRIVNWDAVGEEGSRALENMRRQGPPLDASA